MSLRSSLGRFVRWFVTWPVLVILAINIESLVTIEGISDILPKNWGWIVDGLIWSYEAATNSIALYVTFFLLGCVVYEWVSFTSQKIGNEVSWYHRYMTRYWASEVSRIFAKNGYYRKWVGAPSTIQDLNKRLGLYGLPCVPDMPGSDETENKAYAAYLRTVSSGDFDMARIVVVGTLEQIKGEAIAPLLPLGPAKETQH